MNYIKIPEKYKMIVDLLDKMIDELGDAGVDVSYFPAKAEEILLKYAKKLQIK